MVPMQMQARLSGYMEGKGKPVLSLRLKLSQERARLVSIVVKTCQNKSKVLCFDGFVPCLEQSLCPGCSGDRDEGQQIYSDR